MYTEPMYVCIWYHSPPGLYTSVLISLHSAARPALPQYCCAEPPAAAAAGCVVAVGAVNAMIWGTTSMLVARVRSQGHEHVPVLP